MGGRIVEIVTLLIVSIIIFNVLTHGTAADSLAKDTFNFVNTETRSLEGM